MLSVNSLRVLCSPRRRCVFKVLTCSAHCVSTTKGALHNNMDTRAPVEGRGLVCFTNQFRCLRTSCAAQVTVRCWNCKQPLGKHPVFFCTSCQVIQPPDEATSYFKIMACDCTFTLDTQKLQRRYLQLQRSLHPDNFSQKSVREKEYSESQSALVNKAYTTLLKPLSRGLYMLELEGMRIEEGTDSAADPEFLMELMEINEALDEAQTAQEANKIGQDTKVKLADLTQQIDAALREGELQTARALLAQMKYHANIQEKVKEKLSQFM